MRVSTNGQRAQFEQSNGASGLRSTMTDEDLRREYEQTVRQLLDALEARLLSLPPEQKCAAIGSLAAAVEYGRQVTIRVQPVTVRF